MVNHRMIVAWGYRAFGALLGAASLAGFVSTGVELYRDSLLALPKPGQSFDPQRYGITKGFVNDHALGTALNLTFLDFSRRMAVLSEEVLGFVILLSVLLFLIGRGIAHRARWARVAGMVLAAPVFLFCLIMLPNVPLVWTLAACVAIAVSLYAFGVLGWRYT